MFYQALWQAPLISAESDWILWAILGGTVALSIHLEQKYHWANKITGCIIALLIMLGLSNLGIIPTEAGVYDVIWDYFVPLAVPLLLFRANLKRIGAESGKMLGIYLISSVGTILGGLAAFFALRGWIENLQDLVPMFVGTYTGGAVNFVAMSQSFHVSGEMVSAALVADNLLMALYFLLLVALPGFALIRRFYRHPHEDSIRAVDAGEETLASKFWGRKEISLRDIALNVGTAVVIVAVAKLLANFCKETIPAQGFFLSLLQGLLGNPYLMITTLTMICASIFSSYFEKLHGAQEIGTYLIYFFFAVIGAPASLSMIFTKAPLLLVFAALVVVINLLFTLLVGRLFGYGIEEIVIASNANVGGPTTAAAMAVSKGWSALIIPALLVGTLGYVLGNYYGIFIGTLLR